MMKYAVESIKCDQKGCEKLATSRLRVFSCQMRDESASLFCLEHVDSYTARIDEYNRAELERR